MAEKRRGLGRGIEALIPTVDTSARPRDIFFEPGAPRTGTSNTADTGVSASSEVQADDVSRETSTARRTRAGSATVSRETHTAKRAQSVSRETSARSEASARSDGAAVAGEDAGENNLIPVPGVTVASLNIADIQPNRWQPRDVFDEDDLEELSASIAEVGLLQPIVVRPAPEGSDKPYELIMGERRLRASGLAGLTEIPAVIRNTEDADMLRDALLENLHRANLNPLEEASAYQQLLDDFGITQEELARRIARSRPQISNTLRLLKLPAQVQRRVAAGVLSAGHARALLGLPDGAAMERLAQRIVAEGLSVRATEEIVALGEAPSGPEKRRAPRVQKHQGELNDVASALAERLDTRVKVAMGARKGRITVDFASLEDLQRILDTLTPGISLNNQAE